MSSQFYKYAGSLQQKLKFQCDCYVKVQKSVRKFRHVYLSDYFFYLMSQKKVYISQIRYTINKQIKIKVSINKINKILFSSYSSQFVIISQGAQLILIDHLALRQVFKKQLNSEKVKFTYVKQTLLDCYVDGKQHTQNEEGEIINLIKLKQEHQQFKDVIIKKQKFNQKYILDDILQKTQYYSLVVVKERTNQIVKKDKKKDKNIKLFTVKIYQKKYFTEKKLIDNILNQRKILQQVICPFSPVLYKCIVSPSFIYCMTQGYKGQNLQSYLKNQTIYKQEIKILLAQITIALGQIHQCNVIYNNINLKSIFVNDDGYIMFNDFTNASLVSNKQQQNQQKWFSDNFGQDWLAFANLIFQIKCDKPYKQGQVVPEWKQKHLNSLFLSLSNSQTSQRLGKRGDYYEILNHQFFKGVNKKQIASKSCEGLKKFFKIQHNMFGQKVVLPQDVEDWSIYDNQFQNYEFSRQLDD